MTAAAEKPVGNVPGNDLQKVADLLGGPRILSRRITSALDAHELLLDGLPGSALSHFVRPPPLHSNSFAGKSLRNEPSHLSAAQGRSGQAAQPGAKRANLEVFLAKATDVFGSQEEAEQWLERPAIGLDQRRPIDLLVTPAGVELVEQYLTRLAYGVYA
ncbi:antitoxin Xre/MbcA/ParS toxin-binding domain-containing protein [Bradyrhizobium elkanii]|uniref:antitoxin Xre/MbcA/ParS toxin-binding domain-containing protein n=1 Tax=Bradyrhizobium elkanii TaxID=29448 RepID=UPI000B093105|nr:antitoxin Xre/MbcA/ParS toxin-binding domain-containing protein [Bradyrhizobium elkanii]